MDEETPEKKEPITLIFPDPPKRLSKKMRDNLKYAVSSHIKSGKFSLASKELGKCRNCPIRDSCDDYEKKKKESEQGKKKVAGCNQMRELFKHHILSLTRHEANLISDIAQIQSKLDMQEAKDSYEKVVFSPEWIKGKELAIKEMKLLQDYRENKGRRVIDNAKPIDAEVVEFNTPEEDKEHLGEGDVYIPDTTKEEHKTLMKKHEEASDLTIRRFDGKNESKKPKEDDKTSTGNNTTESKEVS